MQLWHGGRTAEAMPPATVVTIGMFDGVHCGHQALLRRAADLGRELGAPALALTFDRHADEVLRPEKVRPYLSTLPEKVAAVRALGVPLVVVARVTPAFLGTPAREFVQRYLCSELHARGVVVGPDFHFGKGRQGDAALLRSMQRACGYQLDVLDPVSPSGETVSSTLIRRVLASGEVEHARRLLGRAYRLSGEVAHGEEIGRTLGFPTANVAYPPQKILPALGVYLCRALTADGGQNCAAVSVGRRPTFDGTRITVEAYLLDFEGDIYGQTLSLDFLRRLRPERKFAGPGDLREQIRLDVEQARQAWAEEVDAREPGCPCATAVPTAEDEGVVSAAGAAESDLAEAGQDASSS